MVKAFVAKLEMGKSVGMFIDSDWLFVLEQGTHQI